MSIFESHSISSPPHNTPPSNYGTTLLDGESGESSGTDRGLTSTQKYCLIPLKVLSLAVNCLMVTIGFYDMKSCPGIPSLPPSVICMGLFSLIFTLYSLTWSRVSMISLDSTQTHRIYFIQKWLKILTFTVMVILFLFLSIVLYSDHGASHRPQDKGLLTYCDPFLYLFSFWFITIEWVILCICTLILSVCVFAGISAYIYFHWWESPPFLPHELTPILCHYFPVPWIISFISISPYYLKGKNNSFISIYFSM
jgi:hypothetical protein